MNTSVSVRARRVRRLPAYIAALACTLGALAVVQLSDTEADATPAVCTVTPDPLGPATGWTEFIRTDAFRGSSESEGTAAYGGNLTGSGARNVGIHLPATPPTVPTLVVKGALSGTVNLSKGSAYVGSGGTVNFNGGAGAGYLPSSPIDFDAAFATLQTTSTAWAAAPATGTTAITGDPVNAYLELTGTNADLNVFNLTQSSFPAGNGGVRIKAPAGSLTIINVAGSTVDLPANPQKIELWINGSWQQASASAQSNAVVRGIVWNFPTATAVNIRNGGPFAGTVLAPKAHVSVHNDVAHTVGQMIAKSFTSDRETHLPLFLDEGCVPGTPPAPPVGTSNVTITKTASPANPQGGDIVTYSLVVQNIGTATATGVVARDVLPAGVTFSSADLGCSFHAGAVSCDLGDLAPGETKTRAIKVVATPIVGAGPSSHPQAHHWLTPYKKELHVDLLPGELKTVTLACDPGDILSDGQFRLDHVDQGTGTIAGDIRVMSSRAVSSGTWEGILRSSATGRAQGKAFIVCLPKETEAADRQTGYDDSHRHPLSVDPAPVTATAAYATGRHSASLTCPVGTIPIAPGFDAPGGGVRLVASEYDESAPRTWAFAIDVTSPGGATVTLSAQCLRTTVGPVRGHTHDRRFTHVVQTVTVAGHTAKEGDEFKVSCPDDAQGGVGPWDIPQAV